MLSPQAALICAMVAAAGCDGEITRREIDLIGDLVDHLPMFRAIERWQVAGLAAVCSEQLAAPDGIAQIYAQIRAAQIGVQEVGRAQVGLHHLGFLQLHAAEDEMLLVAFRPVDTRLRLVVAVSGGRRGGQQCCGCA